MNNSFTVGSTDHGGCLIVSASQFESVLVWRGQRSVEGSPCLDPSGESLGAPLHPPPHLASPTSACRRTIRALRQDFTAGAERGEVGRRGEGSGRPAAVQVAVGSASWGPNRLHRVGRAGRASYRVRAGGALLCSGLHLTRSAVLVETNMILSQCGALKVISFLRNSLGPTFHAFGLNLV